jgi:hypothetical protein
VRAVVPFRASSGGRGREAPRRRILDQTSPARHLRLRRVLLIGNADQERRDLLLEDRYGDRSTRDENEALARAPTAPRRRHR